MSQFSIARALALTGISLRALLQKLKLDMPQASLMSECISLTALQDVLRESAENKRIASLTRYHAQLEGHQTNLSGPQRFKAISAAETLARADATLAALKSEPTIAMVTKQWAQDQLQTSVHHLQQAQQDYLSGNLSSALDYANLAEKQLTVTLHDAYTHLAQAHRTVLADTVFEALSDMGYTVEKAVDKDKIACLGKKTHEISIAAVIQEDGKLAIDMSGFEDGKCGVEIEEFFRQLRAKGIQTKREKVVPHLRKEGGQLISSAKKHGQDAHALLKADVHSAERAYRPILTLGKSRKPKCLASDARFKAAAAWLWLQP